MTVDGISVVLCVLNEQENIEDQLIALAGQNHAGPWELVVVDNGSTDDTADIVRRHLDRLDLLMVHEPRRGLNAARNRGVATARFDHIAHCDGNDVVAEGWLAALVGGLTTHALVTGPIENALLNDPGTVWEPMRLPADRAPDSNQFLPYTIGANMGYRRGLHRTLGGFDEQFVLGGGDVDFSWRAQQLGETIAFCPNAVVHRRHPTSARGLAKKFFTYGRADPLLYRRHARNGLRRQSARAVGDRWWRLVTDAPADLRDPDRRSEWVSTVGWSAGRLYGCIEHRSLYP